MNRRDRMLTLLFVALVVIPADATAQQIPKKASRAPLSDELVAQRRDEWLAKGVQLGACEHGVASADLDINNVRARLYNTGTNFYRGGPHTYRVPKAGSVDALYAAGIWVVGYVDGELAMLGSEYFWWELWPGPLDENGDPPVDCTQYDRMYKINRQDILDYEETGVATSDLRDWPADLGAPVIDGDGNPDNFDLAAGDRPEIIGDQTIWWVMNDVANVHTYYNTRPLGLELQVTAFAFKTSDALDRTTFYRYKIINKGGNEITDTFLSIWVDPDLGFCCDDYVGSDTTLSVGYVWNGDNDDQGGYRDRPPAVGFDFLQGPVADPDEIDNDRDGEVDEPDERLPMTSFVTYNSLFTVQSDPLTVEEAYQYQHSIWKDKVPITYGGNGRGVTEVPAPFMYPGEPGEYWSESNNDGEGTENEPGDRRFVMTSGPFTLEPGDEQTVTYGIIWARGTDNVDSVRRMKADDRLVQAAFDIDFRLPRPPDRPRVEVSELDETVILKWSYRPSDNNYLDQYEVENLFLKDSDVDDKTYHFEGYNVLRFESETDEVGEVIATFDVANSVTRVLDIVSIDDVTGEEILAVSANGTDSGLQHSIRLEELDNYVDYYFGVQAYGYNRYSVPKVIKSAISRVVVRPSKPLARHGGTVVNTEATDAEFTMENGRVTREGRGQGSVEARVIDPSALTGHLYRVEFFEEDPPEMSEDPIPLTNYNIVDVTEDKLILDGQSAMKSFGDVVPQKRDVAQIDGLSWSVTGPVPGPLDIGGDETWAFVQVEGGIGVSPDACDDDAFSRYGCAQVGGNWVYGSYNGAADWIMDHQGAGPEFVIGNFAPQDFEIRSTDSGSYGYHGFSSGRAIWVPFEVWDVGLVGPHGVNDPVDDVQMVPVLYSPDGGECFFGFGETAEDPYGQGWPGTDRIYAYYPVNDDYEGWEMAIRLLVEASTDGCPTSPETDEAAGLIDFDRGRPLQRLIFYMDTTSPNYREAFIPAGNVIRFLTTKPNLPGDIYVVDTEGYGVEHNNTDALKEALELMTIVPNPYKGASDYEISNLADIVRFTNMPQEATIRIFTLAGTLIKTIYKDGPSTSIEWDLRTDENLPIGSGMYLIHVEVPGVGEKFIKFGAIKKRAHLEFY